MAKEKRQKELEEKDYFKELIAFFIIILMIIFIGNLGILGFYGNLIIKIIFGEWSFILIGIALVSALKYMISGHALTLSTLSFQGFIILYIAIALFCHLSIYNSLGLTSKNVFSKTLELYKNYLTSYEENYYVGGGLVGAIVFQIVIILLGKSGIFLVGIALSVMGLSYLMNRSVWDFVKKYRHIFIFSGKFKSRLITYFKKLKIYQDKKGEPLKRPRPSISMLNDIKESTHQILQREVVKDLDFKVKDLLRHYDLKIEYIKYYVGYSYTTFLFKASTKEGIKEVMKLFDDAFYFEDVNLHIDVKNKFKELLTLKKALLLLEDEKLIPLGVDTFESVINFSVFDKKPYLIIGSKGSGIKTFIRSFIVSVILVYKVNFKLYLIDLKKEYKEMKGLYGDYFYYDTQDVAIKCIDELVYDYDKRYEMLKYLDVSDYLKANEEIEKLGKKLEPIKKTFILLNFNLDVLSNDAKEKLKYLMQVGSKVGLYIFLISREEDNINSLNLNLFNLVIFKINDMSLSLKLINDEIACMLDEKGDFLFYKNEKISHAQAPFCSVTDYLKILEKLIS